MYFYQPVLNWLSHNLWIVIVPFFKTILKKVLAMKLLLFFKSLGMLLFHLSKLLVLKIVKTLTIRYGVFFSQFQWYWIRWCKVMFLRRGKQWFRFLSRFWQQYTSRQQWFILVAFFPIVLLLFLLGLSFNLTRKTMVEKTQETAIFKTAVSATNSSRGIRAWVVRMDSIILERIKLLSSKKVGK